jgi:hypothetical protein
MIRTELYNEDKHYDTLAEFWRLHNWEPVPTMFLPPEGVVVYFNNEIIAVGFLYLTKSSFSFMEWIVADPRIDYNVRSEGITTVLNSLSTLGKLNGVKALHTMTNHNRLIEKYIENNFIETDQGMSSMVRSI